jgi:hypothetical protein
MAEQRRITVEQARAAYRQANISPIRHNHINDDRTCGCVWGAIGLSNEIDPREACGAVVCDWAAKHYGESYRLGVVHGFDASGLLPEHLAKIEKIADYEAYSLGHQDGTEIAAAIFT